eukprot:SAG11_NODE_2439_length_3363_cov_1.689951_2_plen_276_part_00
MALDRAAAAIHAADALLVFSGAGMGVDSGLGTYRGVNAGVWQAGHDLGLDYDQLCRSQHFDNDKPPPVGEPAAGASGAALPADERAADVRAAAVGARLAWGFWKFQYELYTRVAKPHAGYGLLKKWGERARHGLFAVTSNVDGHWPRTLGAETKRVNEVHGSVEHMQIMRPSAAFAAMAVGGPVWPASLERDYAPMVLDAGGACVDGAAPLPCYPKVRLVHARHAFSEGFLIQGAEVSACGAGYGQNVLLHVAAFYGNLVIAKDLTEADADLLIL